jgi:nucleoid-associated protein Lsr2
MAQKYLVQVIDDLDGTELDRDDVEEVRFGLDGRAYVIDLSKVNAAGLRDALSRYTEAARRDQVAGRTSAASKPSSGRRKDLDQVRQWANENGHPVSDRGRVPAAVLEAYDAAR